MTFGDLLDIIPNCCLEVYDMGGYLIQEGDRRLECWENIDKKVNRIYPHNETIRIFLEV